MVELSFAETGGDGPAGADGRAAIAILRAAGYTLHPLARDGRLGPAIAASDFAPAPLENLAFARPELREERPDMFGG